MELLHEVSVAVRTALSQDSTTRSLASYWSKRIDETASDVLGILNMGPSPAIGLIGYFRRLNAAFDGTPTLRNTGPQQWSSSWDIVRGFLAAATVRQLEFSQASAWADTIEEETEKDVTTIRLAGKKIDPEVAKKSARIVSQTIVTHPMASLENHAFGEIQNWKDEDEDIVQQLRGTLTTANPLDRTFEKGGVCRSPGRRGHHVGTRPRREPFTAVLAHARLAQEHERPQPFIWTATRPAPGQSGPRSPVHSHHRARARADANHHESPRACIEKESVKTQDPR
jgi:hypothetical protein